MFRVLSIFLFLFFKVKFIVANTCLESTSSAPVEEVICPKKEVTDWLDSQLQINPGGTGAEEISDLAAKGYYDSFDFIELIAFPVNHSDSVQTKLCISFSVLDLISSESIQFQLSSKVGGKWKSKYRFDYFLFPKNAAKILTVLKNPSNERLACFIVSSLFKNEKNPTIVVKVKSKKVDSKRFDNYSQFYFKIPNWINAVEDCKSEPFIYINSTYRHFEKIIVRWNNCTSLFDLKLAKYEDKTDKQVWVDQIVDADLNTPLVFWQIKDKISTYHYKAEIVAHLENDIPV